MSLSIIKTSFSGGEIAPSLWGSVDLVQFHIGASTMRNVFPNYRRGASSRPGTRFVGQSLAPGDGLPPRFVPFQLSVDTGFLLEFTDLKMRVVTDAGYVEETPKTIISASKANPCSLGVVAHGFSNGDWVAAANVVGMTQLNGRTFIVDNTTANAFTLKDTFGDPVNSLAFSTYVSGGTVARIYTLAAPYALADLPYLKFTQSANEMSLTAVNTVTQAEYAPYDLSMLLANSWVLAAVSFTSSIAAPTGAAAVASNTVANPTQYQYVVTAIDMDTGDESVASSPGTVSNSVNIATTAGTITVTWNPVANASKYRIYKAPAAPFNGIVPIGSAFGLAGEARGTQWIDPNVVQDFTRTPPLHLNPFARGRIVDVTPGAVGAGYTQNTVSVAVTTSTGSGAVILAVVVGATVVAYIVVNGGQGYVSTDTLVVSDSGGGAGATGTLVVGAQSGTYPAVVAYSQQRRAYAASLNAPDTYNMSQTGRYINFDASDPPQDDDAIVGTPWGQQVNGIQWLLPVTGGLLAMTGLSLWKVSGANSVAITPSSQDAEPQEYNGIAPLVPPIRIKQNVLYVQNKGSLVNDLEFNFYNNTFTGTDISVMSNQLFEGREIVQWAWAQEPWKLVWVVRDDGKALSLTYVKDQKMAAWGRHDTNGLFVQVAVVSEPPVDAPYFSVRRYVPSKAKWAYYTERMDARQWPNAETVWAVDCGLALEPDQPAATLYASAASGSGVAFTADAGVFDGVNVGVVGQILRMGGGKATVTSFVSPTQVIGTLTVPIALTMPNDPGGRPSPAPAGQWSIGTAVSTVSGLNHLDGFEVAILADGQVGTRQTVVDGVIALTRPASKVVVGLPFQAQLQTLQADIPGQPSIQGKRQKVPAAIMRLEASRGVKVGTNQPNASAQENQAEVAWGQGTQTVGKMIEYPAVQNQLTAADYLPLYTGDVNTNLDSDWDLTGMVAFQQDNPLPMTVVMVAPDIVAGDSDG